jgi:hypothetical protein
MNCLLDTGGIPGSSRDSGIHLSQPEVDTERASLLEG